MLGRIVAISRLVHLTNASFQGLPMRVNQKVSLKQYRSHFEQRLPLIGNECGDIIREMGKERPNIRRLNALLDQYLQFHQDDDFVARSLEGVLCVISAIGMSGCELGKYKFLLLEQTNRVQLEGKQLAPVELSYFITAEAEYRRSASKEKMKATRLLFNLMVVLESNFAAVDPHLYFSISQTLTSEISYQPRLIKVARLFQYHIVALLRKIVAKDTQLPSGIEKTFSERFLCLISEIYKTYGTDSVQDFQVFCRFIEEKFLSKYFSGLLERRYSYCNSLFRNFNYDLQNAHGVNYKSLLFQNIVKTLFHSPKQVNEFARTKHGYYFCSSVLTHQFYLHSKALSFEQEGSLRYLPKSQLQCKPELPDIFWKIYMEKPQSLNYVSYLANTIKDVYPQRYIPTKGSTVDTIEPFLDTEMKMRGQQALMQLGLPFQAELNISGRYIDFLVGEDVVLELDGIHHFCLGSLEMTDKTHARNLHLLFKGYKLIIINIYEYNVAREIGEFKQLLTYKLALLKQKDAAMVL